MPQFLVTWTIEIDADSAEAAAKEALEIHRDPESIATVFTVAGPDGAAVTIDLTMGHVT